MGGSMDTRKIIQTLAYMAWKQEEHVMDNMKAYKLMWLADRYHVRQYGRTITGDSYFALPHGIIPSDAKHLLENKRTKLEISREYRDTYIVVLPGHKYLAVAQPDLKEFSDSDQDALDKVIEIFGDKSPKELSELSHKFPEWKFYEEMLNDREEKNSYKVNIDHFFENCEDDQSGLFVESEELLSLTKQLYHERYSS